MRSDNSTSTFTVGCLRMNCAMAGATCSVPNDTAHDSRNVPRGMAAPLRCESFRFLEVGQELDRALVEGASGFRQRNAARGAVQETHAKVRLEVGDEA
jgi:hypothetical protein